MQRAVFTVHGGGNSLDGDRFLDKCVVKYTVPAECKAALKSTIQFLNRKGKSYFSRRTSWLQNPWELRS